MSKQFGLALIIGLVLAATVVASYRGETARRDLASIPNATALPLRHTEKLHGPVQVTIDLVGPAPARAGDTFVVKGIVSSAAPLKDVDYHWSLPASVELVAGIKSDRLAVLASERGVELELTLRALDDDNAQIHLLTTARSRGVRFAESAQYNTTRERAFAASRERLGKSTERAQSSPTGDLKIFH